MRKLANAAVVREAGGPYSIEAVDLENLRPNEVYVRVEAAGVCHTDANMQASSDGDRISIRIQVFTVSEMRRI